MRDPRTDPRPGDIVRDRSGRWRVVRYYAPGSFVGWRYASTPGPLGNCLLSTWRRVIAPDAEVTTAALADYLTDTAPHEFVALSADICVRCGEHRNWHPK